MSRQLTISATLSIFAMAVFAVFGSAGVGEAQAGSPALQSTTGAEIAISASAVQSHVSQPLNGQ